MKPIKQKYHTDDSRFEYGDCLRACVASVLELGADEVPHFRHGLGDDDPLAAAKMMGALVGWLRPMGIGLLQFNVRCSTLADALAWCRNYNPESYLILGGIGPGGQGHVVIVNQGVVVHDPGSTSTIGDDGKPALAGPSPNGEFVVLAFEHRPAIKVEAAGEPVEIPPPPDWSLLDRHKRIGLSFSGGKDSLALVHLLRPHWDRLMIYNVDTQDLLRETREIIDQVEAMVPHFCQVTTNSIAWQEKFGMASDLVPYDCTARGRAELHGEAGRINMVDRLTCCGENLHKPLHQKMMADGVTLVIRGTRREDAAWGWVEMEQNFRRGPQTLGDGKMTWWTPIADWSTAQVFAYLRSVGAPIARYYEGRFKDSGPECARCTAYLDGGRGAYLKKYHPALAGDYLARLQRVRSAIRPTLEELESELDALVAPPQERTTNAL